MTLVSTRRLLGLSRAAGNGAYVPLQETVNAVSPSGTAQTIPDPAAGGATMSRIVLNNNCTLTFPTAGFGKSFTLVLVQDATGGRTVTWPAGTKWAGGTAPTLSSGASKIDWLAFACSDGSNWVGFVSALDVR